MVPAAPWVFRMSISNCPGMHAIGGVAVGIGVEVGVDAGVGVTTGVGVTGIAVGELLGAGGDGDPQAASRPATTSSTGGTNTRRIATQGTRKPRSTRVRDDSECPTSPAAPGRR